MGLIELLHWFVNKMVSDLDLTSSSFHKSGTANDSKRSAPQSNFTTTGLGPVNKKSILNISVTIVKGW